MNKMLLIGLTSSMLVLAGCGQDSESAGDIVFEPGSVNIDNSSNDNSVTNPAQDTAPSGSDSTSVSGLCNIVEDTSFVDYDENTDCLTAQVTGVIDDDFIVRNDVTYTFEGVVMVGTGNTEIVDQSGYDTIIANGVTLTIEPGVEIDFDSEGSLVVTRGSKIDANGSATSPITFSSEDANYDGTGEWGGIVIQGFAPFWDEGASTNCNNDGEVWCNVAGEGVGSQALFGGTNEADNSGTLRYVRIAEGGKVISFANEINGLTLQGVGSGTTLEYIQVHGNKDDGVEWFGGGANAKYLVLTNNDDDDIDFDTGYQGNIQYAIVIKNQTEGATAIGSNDPRGIEANSSDSAYQPHTSAKLSNITIVGGDAANNPANSKGEQPGMRLRGAVTVELHNSVVTGYDMACARIDDAATGTDAGTVLSDITFNNFMCGNSGDVFNKELPDLVLGQTIVEGVTLDDRLVVTNSPVLNATQIQAIDNKSSFTFDSTTYVGAVDPNMLEAWWEGWTIDDTVSVAKKDAVTTDFASCDGNVCTITGTIDNDYTLVSGTDYKFEGVVMVGTGNTEIVDQSGYDTIIANGVTLTIEPGVEIDFDSEGSLVVTRGSKIDANGSATSPITFSSEDANYDGTGEWGGIVIQGFAPFWDEGASTNCNNDGEVWCNVAGEGVGSQALFGGTNEADNSGTLRYVRIAEGGKVISFANEINGLTLQGVGSGTTLEYIQVHGNKDDGVEWFGGGANAKYLVLTNNDDDDIDFDTGYQGNIQYAIVIKNQTEGATAIGSNDPRGIEANSSDSAYQPHTSAKLSNITIVGGDAANNPANSKGEQPGMRLRGAVTVELHNSAVLNYLAGCARLDDAETGTDAGTVLSSITLNNFMCDAAASEIYTHEDPDTVEGPTQSLALALDSNLALTNAEAIVGDTVILSEAGSDEAQAASSFSFDVTDYVGAVDPQGRNWWQGWVIQGTVAVQ